MFSGFKLEGIPVLLCWAAIAVLAAANTASAKDFSVLYNFTGGAGGGAPAAGLIGDNSGNLYGTAQEGGVHCNGSGCGTVFALAPDGTLSVLYTFLGGTDGAEPLAGLFADASGHLYGTTNNGGTGCFGSGCGTVYEIAGGSEKLLYTFTGGSDGSHPQCVLIEDGKGNLLGTTVAGGADGYGTVFRVKPNGSETVLYSFTGGNDGASPSGGLLADRKGNLFGTTFSGGVNGMGTVFELKRDRSEVTLYSFAGSDGAAPAAGLIADHKGNFYGTTNSGGADDYGTVFELSPDGSERVLHSFASGSDGQSPAASLVRDRDGNLYGTTTAGGGGNCNAGNGCGVVFELAPGGEKILYAFKGTNDGANPHAPLLLARGFLFGTAEQGGADAVGTLFGVKK